MRFFTLIHICRDEQSIHNNSFTKNFDEQISLYLTCAKQLHCSLQPAGIELCVLTNEKEFLQRLNNGNYPIEIIQLNFTSTFPSGIKFYSAHYKLDVFPYLATLSDDYIALVDADMLCINDVPETFKTIIAKKLPLYYDITDQVTPAYGAANIINDKESISKKPSVGLWAGGEFMAGPPSFFSRLHEEINTVKENYLQQVSLLHHQGDEVLSSIAIENLKTDSPVQIMDAGGLSIVGRYWSFVPIHLQRPIEAYADHFLIHLPSDKKFIARLRPDEMRGAVFFKKYSRHVAVSRSLEKVFKNIKPYAKRLRKKFAF